MQMTFHGSDGGKRFAISTFAYCALAVALISGCAPSGPKTYPVSGSVTLDGEPIPEGYISFAAQSSGETPVAGKIEAGEYSVYATAGAKKVSIQASRFIGPENPIMGLRAKEQYIPERYNLATTLTATVSPSGENQFDFALTSSVEEEDAN